MYIITGSLGLVGYSTCCFFLKKGKKILGIDNNMRKYFFGENSSNKWKEKKLTQNKSYKHFNIDIRNKKKIFEIIKKNKNKIEAIIHTAAQPSHDWSTKEPLTDFYINSVGTLNLLEALRIFCPDATFIFTSTNKVYGDRPNFLPLIEKKFRYEIRRDHKYFKQGIDEKMSIDNTTHSLFGVSKSSADLLVQEYGRYFNLKTVCFRAGCLTGENHSGARLHGFLSFLVKSIVKGEKYFVFGYKGKQVRDNIHGTDVARAFYEVLKKPIYGGKVYNLGGGRLNSCSILEAIKLIENICHKKSKFKILSKNRIGDHKWWISDNSKFKKDYPQWKIKYSLSKLIEIMVENELRDYK